MKVKCDMCDGTGKYWVSPEDDCLTCKGKGTIEVPGPTSEDSAFWIQANGKTDTPPWSEKGIPGKWLLFINKSKIDDTWEKIREETIKERLGSSSKVSTKKGWLYKGMPEDYVICVHTANSADKDDVLRVRSRLRELGFTSKLGYKTDKVTFNNEAQLLYKD